MAAYLFIYLLITRMFEKLSILCPEKSMEEDLSLAQSFGQWG